MRTYVEVDAREVVYRGLRDHYVPHAQRTSAGFATAFSAEYLKAYGERIFYERAGWSARPIDSDGLVWTRDDYNNCFRAYCDIPSPEGMLF